MTAPSEATTVAWREVVDAANPKECYQYAVGFRRAANDANDATQKAELLLLSDVCEPFLREEGDDVLAPRDRIDALTGEQLDSLVPLLATDTDAELRARVGDVLWLRRHDRKAAEAAVTAYLESAVRLEDPTNWCGCFWRIQRALRLAASLGKRNAPFTAVVAHIELLLDRLGGKDPLYLSAKLMELLLEHRLGDAQKYGKLAMAIGADANAAHDGLRAETLYNIAARWFDLAKDAPAARAARIASVEALVSLADVTANAGGNGVAAMHMQKAIEALRRVGNQAARVEELLKTMREYQQRSVRDFREYSASVDLTEEVKQAIAAVRGKPTVTDALIALATLTRSPSVAGLKQVVMDSARESPMRYLFATSVVDAKTGRTTGLRQPAPGLSEKEALEPLMFDHARMLQHLTACLLEPARRAICEEHHVRDEDLSQIVRHSPFLPPGHDVRFARGLAAGLRGDFMLATALLVPQLENSLRFVVEQNGGRGFGLDSEGIQDGHQLDHLLGLELVKQIFGEDVVFDLRGLLIERFGSNLRHLEAHGLLDDDQCRSTTAAYVWWLALRLCVLFALVATQPPPHEAKSTPEAPK